MKKTVAVGIDPGVRTGIGIYDCDEGKLLSCHTVQIHEAFNMINNLSTKFDVFVVAEDARKRKWFGKRTIGKTQGAGAIKLQSKQWEDFLASKLKQREILGYRMIHPLAGGTKMNESMFWRITGYTGRTSEHARDASMLVFGTTKIQVESWAKIQKEGR